MKTLLAPLLIYIASCFYVLAQYYHLHLSNWTFLKALLIALPLVVVEYTFALNGNKLASQTMSPTQIITMTVGFYILNVIILNLLVFKNEFSPVRDVTAIILIFAAILISSNTRLH